MKVFISSTGLDLLEYRQAAIDVCLKLGLLPVAMEHFEAMGVGANEGSKDKLGKCDVYVGIFAYRYGYIEDGYETSVTENEFEYAGQRGLDRLCFVVDPKTPWPEENRDYENRVKHLEFMTRVNKLIRAQFTSVDDFSVQLIHALIEWKNNHPESYHEDKAVHRGAQSAILIETVDGVQIRPARFIGRAQLIRNLHTRLDRNERVLLQGFGGTGKTALAAEVTAQRIAQGKKPVVWLRAGESDIDSLLDAIARTFDKQQEMARQTGDAKIGYCLELLREKNLRLLVLDNVWNEEALIKIVDAVPQETPLLVTSRLRLMGLKRENVGNLALKEALELLGSLHGDRDYRKDPDAKALCERLGNLAFAVYVAGQVLAIDDLTPKELLSLINTEPYNLELPMDFAGEGYRSVADLLNVSLSRLEPEAQAAFLGFGAFFSPTVTPDLLARYMKKSEKDVERILREKLQRRGLTQRLVHEESGIAYYRIHDLAFSYARAQQDGVSSREQAFAACQAYAQLYKDDIRKSDIELANLLGACEMGGHKVLISIMRSLTSDANFFTARGHTQTSLKLLNTAADAAQDPEVKHAFLCDLAYTYCNFLGDLNKGYTLYTAALEIARQANNPCLEAMALTRIGTVVYQQSKGSPDVLHQRDQERAAYRNYRKAKRIAEQQGDPQALSLVLQHLGFFYMTRIRTNHEIGSWLSDKAASIAADGQIDHIYFHALRNRGNSEMELGRLELALSTHKQAYKFAEEKSNLGWMADALGSIGEDHDAQGKRFQAQGDLDAAAAEFKKAQTALSQAYSLCLDIRAIAKAEELAEFVEELGYKPTAQKTD